MGLLGKSRRDKIRGAEAERVALSVTNAVSPPGGKEAHMFGDKGHGEDGVQANTYMGKGSQVSGKLTFEGTVRIDGQVDGEIAAQESVLIGETAVVKAQLTADSVVITGKVTGDITARRRVEIRAPGKLYGNITTPSLVIHDGVVFEGHCSMGGAEGQKPVTVGGASARKDDALAFTKEDRDKSPVNLNLQSEMKL
jgi:cytoskeletal protein CcmA (bactofilin family)